MRNAARPDLWRGISDGHSYSDFHRLTSAVQGRTTVTRPVSFIGFRELMSARGHALLQLFLPVQNDRDWLFTRKRLRDDGEKSLSVR
jgi:hypothetical protein